MYFFTVSLCIPNSRAIPRMDSPLRFAFCTAFHLAVCNGVGFLRRGPTILRTRPVATGGGNGLLGIVIVVQGRQSGHLFAIQTNDRVMDYG